MTYVETETAIPSEVVSTVLMHLKDGNIQDAIACFAEKFEFNDRGIGLEFNDRERLADFFQKTRELYPDSSLQTDRILVSGDYVITEWTLRYTLAEPFYVRVAWWRAGSRRSPKSTFSCLRQAAMTSCRR